MQHILVCCLNSNRIQSIQGITDFYLETKPYEQTRLVIKAFDNVFYLHLEPNTELFHPQAVIYQNGQSVPVDRDIIYKGHVIHADDSDYIWSNYKEQQDSLGWARLMIYKRSNDPEINDLIIIYKDSDVLPSGEDSPEHHACGIDQLPIIHQTSVVKRSEGCPASRKILYIGVAADCTYVQHYKSREAARMQIVNDFNTASVLFEDTFNITLGLINITLMDQTCPASVSNDVAWNRVCEPNYSLYDRLSDFSLWRSQLALDGAGLWHLMTNCPIGLEVGLAWLGQLCNTGLSKQEDDFGKTRYVSGASVSSITRDEWKIVAHEIGHSFGAIHDCNSQSCPCTSKKCSCCSLSNSECSAGGAYIMNPTSNSSVEKFSPCSINTICSSLSSVATCLSDPQDHTQNLFQLNVCGNGIKEDGEDCDTGGVESVCCDPKTCKFINDAVCEDTNEGCCHQCRFQSSEHVCRPAVTLCDKPEYCTGTSGACPPDTYENDGAMCGYNGLACVSGQCTSRDQQCFARGYAMNITSACSERSSECKMLCDFPGDEENCILFSANFLDGTPCGINGKCSDGTCIEEKIQEKEILKETHHDYVPLPLIVPLTSVMILLLCAACLIVVLRRRKNTQHNTLETSGSSTLALIQH
ncbi:hypothetical protein CU097_009933 [Rhizopus azygosporus]|uniref:Disintegrin and metalloproteinase domain-containing protein B n=1 Tax=Rhizopus azygosporus TaxID=86630 RepID=A0A367KE33_RHIAZ|nr:hypothetical protein CU097_009933 [Rhizopus azygosporus]